MCLTLLLILGTDMCVAASLCCIASQCDAVCCSVLQCAAVCSKSAYSRYSFRTDMCVHVYVCVAVSSSVLQRVAVCCSVLQLY